MLKLCVINLVKRTQLGYKYKWPGHSFYVFHNNSETSDLRPQTAYTRISWPSPGPVDQATGLGVANYKKQLRVGQNGEGSWEGWSRKSKWKITARRGRGEATQKMAYTNKSHGIMSWQKCALAWNTDFWQTPTPRPRPNSMVGLVCVTRQWSKIENILHRQTGRHDRLWTAPRRYLFDAFECDKWDSISSV